MRQVFLLSPARCDGRRAAAVLNPRAEFSLAVRLREAGAPLVEVFTFLSGLYFRGKIAYSDRFAEPPESASGAFIITTDRGLVTPDVVVTTRDLHAFGEVDIGVGDTRFRAPLERDAIALRESTDDGTRIVILGGIATGKYSDPLLRGFGPRLVFPQEFVGRGDMSRGGLMLRAARDGRELEYVSVDGAIRHGKRPPKLEPIPLRRERR